MLRIINSEDRGKLSQFLIKDGVLEKYLGEESRGVVTPKGVKVIGRNAFGPGLTDLYISDGVEEIQFLASDLKYIKKLRLPDSLKKIGYVDESNMGEEKDIAINISWMTLREPFKPIISCSQKIKEMLLSVFSGDSRSFYEEAVEWR